MEVGVIANAFGENNSKLSYNNRLEMESQALGQNFYTPESGRAIK